MKRRSPWFLFAVDGDDWRELRQLSVRRGRALRAATREQQYFNGTLVIVQTMDGETGSAPKRETAERPPQRQISDAEILEIQQLRNRLQLTPTTQARRTRKVSK